MPKRVHVPHGKRPPKGVLWADSEVLGYHARRTSAWSMVRHGVPDEYTPAQLEHLRQDIADYRAHRGPAARMNFNYYCGRDVACPYRCALDSKECPVDVLIEEINKPV